MGNTKLIKLASGITCEIKEFSGKHQRLLSQQRSGSINATNLDEVLADIVESVGNVKVITVDFVRNMLQVDRKKILLEARQFMVEGSDFEKEYIHTFSYVSATSGKPTEHKVTANLSEGFPTKSIKSYDKDGNLVEQDYAEDYSAINREIEVLLPKSKRTVVWTRLSGIGEALASKLKREEKNSHAWVNMRNPKVLTKTKESVIPIKLNLDDTHPIDIAFLEKSIKEIEGSVDSEVQFEHPERDGKLEVIDLSLEMGFFYLSGAI